MIPYNKNMQDRFQNNLWSRIAQQTEFKNTVINFDNMNLAPNE